MLIQTSALSEKQLEQLIRLAATCKQLDSNLIPLHYPIIAQPRYIGHNLLYYHQEQLVGFLSPFFFYDDACEIALLIRPNFRRKNIAKTLIQQLIPLLHAEKINRVIFSVSDSSSSLQAYLLSKSFKSIQTEYQMSLQITGLIHHESSGLIIRQATLSDLEELCKLDQNCFPDPLDRDMRRRFRTLLTDPNYIVLVASLRQQLIGKSHMQLLANHVAQLTDIAITPRLQSNGYGSHMLIATVNLAIKLQVKQLILDVDSMNLKALHLYKKSGFDIINTMNYWEIDLTMLAKHYSSMP
ncbi:MAG: GNAT family N-acetyltransferase [Legionella sp.]